MPKESKIRRDDQNVSFSEDFGDEKSQAASAEVNSGRGLSTAWRRRETKDETVTRTMSRNRHALHESLAERKQYRLQQRGTVLRVAMKRS